jgi:hypothetical protein
MNTKIYFETYASGMKARLDPAYRQLDKIQRTHDISPTPKNVTKSSQNAFVPFAHIRKSF